MHESCKYEPFAIDVKGGEKTCEKQVVDDQRGSSKGREDI